MFWHITKLLKSNLVLLRHSFKLYKGRPKHSCLGLKFFPTIEVIPFIVLWPMPSELQGFPLRLMKTGATLRLCKLQELFPLLLQVLSFHTCTDRSACRERLGGQGVLWKCPELTVPPHAALCYYSSLQTPATLASPNFHLYFLNSSRPLGFLGLSPTALQIRNFAGSKLQQFGASLVGFPSIRNHCPALLSA